MQIIKCAPTCLRTYFDLKKYGNMEITRDFAALYRQTIIEDFEMKVCAFLTTSTSANEAKIVEFGHLVFHDGCTVS